MSKVKAISHRVDLVRREIKSLGISSNMYNVTRVGSRIDIILKGGIRRHLVEAVIFRMKLRYKVRHFTPIYNLSDRSISDCEILIYKTDKPDFLN